MPVPERKPSNVYLAPAHLNHIRATIDWQGLFEGLELKRDKRKSKPNDWWAFSPFQEENTASFHMGPGGIWYDFSAGMGGGPIELVQRIYSLNCYEAANHILEQGWAKSALTVRDQENLTRKKVEKVSKSSPQNEPIRQDLLPMCTYHDYLAKRGVSEATCKALGIGYLPQGRSPLRGRIVFQVRDARIDETSGKRETVILSHLGRTVDDETKPKYLFYEGFHKSAELYGQDVIWTDPEARKQIEETGHIVLTEGPFDVAKAYEAGLRNVVGSFGASLNKHQINTLKSIQADLDVKEVLIVYDRDKAGIKGAVNARDCLSEIGIQVVLFDWHAQLSDAEPTITIPRLITDLGQLSCRQISWLRHKRLI